MTLDALFTCGLISPLCFAYHNISGHHQAIQLTGINPEVNVGVNPEFRTNPCI